jgi:hypothetical protein
MGADAEVHIPLDKVRTWRTLRRFGIEFIAQDADDSVVVAEGEAVLGKLQGLLVVFERRVALRGR